MLRAFHSDEALALGQQSRLHDVAALCHGQLLGPSPYLVLVDSLSSSIAYHDAKPSHAASTEARVDADNLELVDVQHIASLAFDDPRNGLDLAVLVGEGGDSFFQRKGCWPSC
jgi:hypothetical protein